VRETFDVVIVGGAVVGSAAAFFLMRELDAGAKVLVLERDPSYSFCATTRSLASIRHQFSTPENIRMSMFGTRFLRQAGELLAVGGAAPDLGFREGGYLFLATEAGRAVLEANHRVQREEGAGVALLDRAALARRFPWLAVDDLAAGSLGLCGEGWLDGHALLHALKAKAVALGARYRTGHAVAFEVGGASGRSGRSGSSSEFGGAVEAVRLADGTRIACGHAINAAGTGARALAASAGIALPVRAKKRCVFAFRSPAALPGCPLVIDPTGLYFRPEGEGFLCGIAPPEHEDPDADDFDVPLGWFEERLWPLLARRVPGFEAARLGGAWAGHYDVNLLDHNVILGAHPQVARLWFANGFSGHGLQQAPAVGRALAELIAHGRFVTLDLSALGWGRVIEGRPLREVNVV
jgi:glycine/D-amino acid oxidase-like deaminating enzyme